jgi:hypothetical protein
MRMRHAIVRPLVWIAVASLLPTPGVGVVLRAQTAKPAPTAKPAQTAKPAPAAAAPAVPGWPRV